MNSLTDDTILANGGYDICDAVCVGCASHKIPAMTNGKDKLFGIEVEQTQTIVNVCIHVEPAIGNIR